MAIKKENYIYKVDRDNYFEQYAWALENYDLKAAFADFLKPELTDVDDEEIEKQWQQFKYNNEKGIITDKMIDILNYVMKYENGVYKKDDEIAVLYEGRGNIQIQEPGYYMIELKGASGLNKIECKNFLMTGDNKIVKYLDESKENALWIDPHLNFISILKNRDKYDLTRGYIEFNKNFIFLFKFENKENENNQPNRQISPTEKTDIEENIEEQFFKREDFDGNATFYDFAKFNTDPFSKEFFTLKFILKNNAVFYNSDIRSVYNDLQGFLCGADKKNTDEILSGLNDCTEGDYYYEIIRENIKKPTGKLFTFNDVLKKFMGKTNAPFKDFNINYMHGGDGGYVKAIVKFNEPINFQYNVGKANSKDNTATYLISNKETYYAEKGGNVFSKNDDTFEFFNQFSDNSVNLDDLPQVKDKFVFEDQACKDFRNKTNFHVGEQFGYNDYKAGCGRGIVCRTNKNTNEKETHVFYGGGQLGSGLRLNEFENAYYQVPEDGFIKITYLSSKYAQKFPLDIETIGADNLFYIEDNVPISGKIELKISTNSLFGGMKNDDDLKKDKLVDTKRNINYLSFNLDTKKFKNDVPTNIKLNYDQNLRYIKYSNSDKSKFIGLENTNNENEELSTSDYFNALFPQFSIDENSKTTETNLNFLMSGSLSFINYLLFAYNSANTDDDGNENGTNEEGGLRINVNDFNSTTNCLELNLKNFNNFNFINAFDEIIQLSFNYKNVITLNSYYDIFSQEVLEGCEGKITGLEYSIVDPDIDPSSFISYTEGTKFIIPKYTKLYIKVLFNTSRVLLDEDECNLFGINNFYKKNVDFDKKIVLDQYFGGKKDGVNFQCFEFIPNATQDISLFIKRNTYKLNIYNDLFNNLNVRNLSNKLDFEVGEACILSFDLKNYERISHLRNKKSKNDPNSENVRFGSTIEDGSDIISNYFMFDTEHQFESFFEFWDDKTKYEYNINNICIQKLLNRQYCNNVISNGNSEKGIICQITRKYRKNLYEDIDSITENELKNIIYLNDDNTIDNENCVIYVYFKDCNMNIRLSSNYSTGQKLCVIEKNNVLNLDVFKNYKFVVYGVGGPTGNGESGGDTSPYSASDTCLGGCGGDGYIGGNGGNGGNTGSWGVFTEGWRFLIRNFGMYMSYSGGGGLGGRGFREIGSRGTSGTSAFGKQPVYYIQCDDKLDDNDHTFSKIKSPYYTGIHFIGEVSIFSEIDNFQKILLKIISGEQGLSLSKAQTGFHGRGGGQGIMSYIEILNKDDNSGKGAYFQLTQEDHVKTLNINSSLRNNFEAFHKKYKYLVFEGGRPGLCRGVFSSLGAYAIKLWEVQDPFEIKRTESYVPSHSSNDDSGLLSHCYKEFSKYWGIGYKFSGKYHKNEAKNVDANAFYSSDNNFDKISDCISFITDENGYSKCGFLTFSKEENDRLPSGFGKTQKNGSKESDVSSGVTYADFDNPHTMINTNYASKLLTNDRTDKNLTIDTKNKIKDILSDNDHTLFIANCNENYNNGLDSVRKEHEKALEITKNYIFQGNLYNSVETGIVKIIVSNSYDKNYLIENAIKISETNPELKFKYNDLLEGKIENCELNEFTLTKGD